MGNGASATRDGGPGSGSNTPAVATMKFGTRQSMKRKLEDEYFVQKVQLGSGSFGVVHRAIHKPTSQDRAVKSIDKRRLEMKPNHKQHLQREIEIMRECSSHANVVKLFDWFEDDHYIHLVLEYCGGGDFGDKILQCRTSITEKQACEWVYQILLAVDHLHSKGVCHRDIKPENFLISGINTLKLSDFGLAIRIDPKKSSLRELAGTPAYQAPEIHNLNNLPASSGTDFSSTGYGLPVDLWACGVTLYTILSGGKNPFVSSRDNKLQLGDIRTGNVRFDELIVTYSIDDIQSKNSTTLTGRLWGSKNRGSNDPSNSPRFKPNPGSNAENLMRLLLTVDPSRRLTVGDALRHPWFVQHGLASPPPGSPPTVVHPALDRAQNSMDSSSLEASPPTMEPILADPRRHTASSFELNIEESSPGKSPGAIPSRNSGGGLQQSSMTIGPRGSTEGKVVRCDKCGSFFYSQRGQAVACPECRVQLGYALPPDGVALGMYVYYPSSGGAKTKWSGSRIAKFLDQSGDFEMEDGSRIAATSVAPPGRDVGSGPCWPKGTNVVYLSGTYGTWLPAYIEGFNEGTRTYDLDVKTGVSAEKIRARVKRITKT